MAQAHAVPVSGSKLDNRRVLAALIDLVIVGAGWAVIMAAAGVLGKSMSEVGAPLVAVTLGWALYYYFACESGNGQTVGKRVMKIRVVGLDGAPAGMREIGLRTILRVIDGLFFYLIGLIVMLSTRERRGRLGDLVGATKIVSADEPAQASPAAVAAPALSRVPIGESGPAFEPMAETEPAGEPDEPGEPDVASPSLKALASDVTAVTEAPDRELEEEPVAEAEEEPVVLDEEPVVVLEEEPVAESEEEPVAESEEEPVAEYEEELVQEADEDPVVVLEEEPVVVLDEEPPAEADEEPVAESDEEPAVEAEQPDAEPEEADGEADDEAVTVKSVETVSAMDVVMGEDEQEAADKPRAKASKR